MPNGLKKTNIVYLSSKRQSNRKPDEERKCPDISVCQPEIPVCYKKILTQKWDLMKSQPLLRNTVSSYQLESWCITYFAPRSLKLVLPYVLQKELNNVYHVSLMLRKCDHPYQRSANVQTSRRTTFYYIKVSGIPSGIKLINIGTQGVQELFFL